MIFSLFGMAIIALLVVVFIARPYVSKSVSLEDNDLNEAQLERKRLKQVLSDLEDDLVGGRISDEQYELGKQQVAQALASISS